MLLTPTLLIPVLAALSMAQAAPLPQHAASAIPAEAAVQRVAKRAEDTYRPESAPGPVGDSVTLPDDHVSPGPSIHLQLDPDSSETRATDVISADTSQASVHAFTREEQERSRPTPTPGGRRKRPVIAMAMEPYLQAEGIHVGA